MTLTGPGAAADVTGTRGARVNRIPPPLYYAAAFGGGMALRGLSVPLAIGGQPVTNLAGGGLLVAGIALAAAGVRGVVRGRTTIVPHRPVAALLTTGVYGLSRNPMYTGLALASLGGALLAGSWWPVLTLAVALVVVRVLVIAPEEHYLAERFGQRYADYRAVTRRWL